MRISCSSINRPNRLRGIQTQVHRPEIFSQAQVTFPQLPFGERRQFATGIVRKNRFADVEKIDPAIESARPSLGAAMSALGDHARHAMRAGKERENLRCLAELSLAEANAAVGYESHNIRQELC